MSPARQMATLRNQNFTITKEITMSESTPRISAGVLLWLRLSVIYLIVGISLGIHMGATQAFDLRPVHAHINLLGWALAAIAGITYALIPSAGNSKLGKAHFWLHQTGVPLMLIALTLVLQGNTSAVPALVTGEVLTGISVLAYFANLLMNARPS